MANPWYARYPGDYAQDTGHLTLIEHGAYTLLLDHYYSVGGAIGIPPSKNKNEQMHILCIDYASNLYRICRAISKEEREAVDRILGQFFTLTPEGYRNERADKEILTRKEKAESKKIGAAARWKKDPEEARRKRRNLSKDMGTHTDQEWQMVLSMYAHECCKCGISAAEVTLTKDHVIPTVKGGPDTISNIQPLCHSCNASKGDSIEDYRQIAIARITAKLHASEMHLHTQPQPQSHILQQQQHAGDEDQAGDKKTTGQEMRFVECFDDHEADLKRVFPHADYEAEKLKCIAHYAKGPSVGPDPWPTVSKWFGRIPKPTTRQTLPDVRTENYEAAREFCNDAR